MKENQIGTGVKLDRGRFREGTGHWSRRLGLLLECDTRSVTENPIGTGVKLGQSRFRVDLSLVVKARPKTYCGRLTWILLRESATRWGENWWTELRMFRWQPSTAQVEMHCHSVYDFLLLWRQTIGFFYKIVYCVWAKLIYILKS